MQGNFTAALELVLKHEGGFVDHPDDPGGATNRGVTIATFRRFFGNERTVDELRLISDAQVEHIYRLGYWDAVRSDQLPSGVDFATFDFAVNSGPGRAARELQARVGAHQDGSVGDQTIASVRALPAAQVINELCDARLAFLRGLSGFSTFGAGWTTRVAGVRNAALAMAGQSTEDVPSPAVTTTSSAPATHRVTARPDLNLRNMPSTAGVVIAELPTNLSVALLGGAPVDADGFRWVELEAPVSGGFVRGWAAEQFLAPLAGGGSVPQAITDLVMASPNLNVRAAPSLGAAVIAELADRTGVVREPDAAVEADGHRWVKISAVVGGASVTGWVASHFLKPV